MTTKVPRGANRPFAAGKRSKASQTGMLPARSEAQREARAAEIAAAREEVLARAGERMARADVVHQSEAWQAAQSFISVATRHGWESAGCVVSYSGDFLKATAVVTRGDERLATSWQDAVVVGHPLYTVGGRNHRLASHARAIEAICTPPGTNTQPE